MAFVSLPSAKSNVVARSAAGMRGVRFPATGLTETPVLIPGASEDAADPPVYTLAVEIPHGEHRHERVPAANRLDARELHRLHGGLFAAHYAANGVVTWALYNLGDGANNVAQSLRYEVLGASGNRLHLRGRHPGRVGFGNSVQNPEWPGVDPETGEALPRLISTMEWGSLPPGAMIGFEWPSGLANVYPMVLQVESPTESGDLDACEFWLETSCSMAAAMQSLDLRYPPPDGRYYCWLWWYFTAPEPHPNYQPQIETQWSRRQITIGPGDLTAGRVELLDNAGGHCRVLWPGMPWHEDPIRVEVVGAAGSRLVDATTILETTDRESGWETWLDLSGEVADFVSARITFWPESVPGDTARYPWYGSCSNSQVDHSGGYAHEGGRVCRNVECPHFAAGKYRATCWAPAAAGFGLGNGSATAFGSLTFAPSSPADGSHVSRWWQDCSIVVIQAMEGTSQYFLRRSGGPSLGELCGGWALRVPRGKFAAQEAWHGPTFGRRVVTTDGEGNATQTLEFGLHEAAAEADASVRDKSPGLLHAIVSGWHGRSMDGGEPAPGDLRGFPAGHVGRCHLHDLEASGGALAQRQRVSDAATEDRHAGPMNLASAEYPLIGNWARGLLS